MIASKDFIASTLGLRLPDFIRNHSVWRDKETINKVFPSIGLPNCRARVRRIDERARALLAEHDAAAPERSTE